MTNDERRERRRIVRRNYRAEVYLPSEEDRERALNASEIDLSQSLSDEAVDELDLKDLFG